MSPEKKYRGVFEKVILRYVQDKLKDREDIDYSSDFHYAYEVFKEMRRGCQRCDKKICTGIPGDY